MKRKILFVCLLLSSVIRGFAQTTVVDSFQCDGVWRSYRLYVPANYSTGGARPLIINMHGLGSNAYEQQYYSNFMPIADTAGFLMAYPQGLSALGTTYWNVGIPYIPPTNDVKFISALIDTISLHYQVNKQQVYATGMSLGGYMSHYLALNLNDRIAAIASVAGTMYQDVYSSAHPGRAVPMMQIHGTADSTVPYNGNGLGIAIDTLVAFWVRNNRCSNTPVHTALPDLVTADQCTATHDVYTGGSNGSTCEFYRIEGGEHTWPGSPITIGVTNQDFNASVEIWRFFRKYQLSQFVGIEAVNKPWEGIYPNPNNGIAHIDHDAQTSIWICDASGRQVLSSLSSTLVTSALPTGIYLVHYQHAGKAVMEKMVKQ